MAVHPVTMASGLNGPTGLAVSADGVLHAAIAGDNKIVKIPAPNDVDDFAPLGAGANPQGIAFDADGNLFVANKGTDAISKVTPGGGVSTFANSMDVTDPVGVLVNAANKIVVLHADKGGEILEFNTNGNGKPKSAASQLGTPTGIAIDSIGNYYVGTTGGVVKKVVGQCRHRFRDWYHGHRPTGGA
jgi:serine/threonine-protein kinase